MTRKYTVLVVEDSPSLRHLLKETLEDAGIDVIATSHVAKALEASEQYYFDGALIDLSLPDGDGITLLQQLRPKQPAMATIVVTAFGTMDSVVEAMRAGAIDFLKKPFVPEEVLQRLQSAINLVALKQANQTLLQETGPVRLPEMIGDGLEEIRKLVARVASTDIPILLTGETGTGKEIVARYIHGKSGRDAQPFLALNMAALPAEMIESELFGTVRGAFTDARDREGKFEAAGKGTLFLDEIGDMPLAQQAKLLRVLEEGVFTRLGESRQIPLRARVIAATNHQLQEAISAGRFRADLYFRLAAIEIPIPPLRKRRDDIIPLVHHFLAQANARFGLASRSIEPSSLDALREYSWPGNVRELKQVVERAALLSQEDSLRIPLPVGRSSSPFSIPEDSLPLEAIEELHIQRVLEACHGNRTETARILGIDRSTLQAKLKKILPST
ncbi:MAG: sigma-54-dependent Fis family transcriptional regulator [Nitrospira sp.]|nr:sigma-54-dependent Fis family transcriptional regulator [Nitrospira sp.]MCA9467821.1 sigma-54-dependent Fis family transcriptional regulator [Nitrospira sp.]MCA9475052.1 sigma-54-dependent Fis family transcriptional regulator [Nitrospira sp.]